MRHVKLYFIDLANNKGIDRTVHTQSGLHLCCLHVSLDVHTFILYSYSVTVSPHGM